jgi:hypothetical protein
MEGREALADHQFRAVQFEVLHIDQRPPLAHRGRGISQTLGTSGGPGRSATTARIVVVIAPPALTKRLRQ